MIVASLISYPQAIILGLLQGVSELFPVSSLGHSVILPKLLGWNIHQNDKYFLTFLVATHLATAIVLFLFFWRDWMRIFKGLGRSLRDREISEDDPDARLGWLLVVGTIPAGILGLTLEHSLRKIFASPTSAAIFLTLNGLAAATAPSCCAAARRVTELEDDARIARTVSLARVGPRRRGAGDRADPRASPAPGATIGGGLLVGLSHKDAARFAFLLATPIIGAAALLKLPELFGSTGDGVRGQALVGARCARG